ncbi:DUF6152 family protein [Cupriavidus alkaliphilus]|uniref:DUF6152 family protein n=1 Tax=Cupriavidus alkaliphilus TaxID=942866 RepID=UPI0016227BA2|nr:DUF6152 family protein [Cupriavidus alkaliphilus]MBB2919452.1 hypothetical protein [Cupriavidus alkaliphilus]
MKRTMTRWVAIALSGVAMTLGWPALAHHGWGYYDTATPLYFSGRVVTVTWRNPHPQVTIEVEANTLPRNWNALPIPPELAELGFCRTLAAVRASAPPGRWTLDLAPINRLERWGMPREPRPGDRLEAIGFPSCNDRHAARPALIVLDGVGVRQQSVALPAGCSGAPRG